MTTWVRIVVEVGWHVNVVAPGSNFRMVVLFDKEPGEVGEIKAIRLYREIGHRVNEAKNQRG